MYEITFEMKPSECWYGFCVDHGTQFPLTKDSSYEMNLDRDITANQIAPLLLSNLGRSIWSDQGFHLNADAGVITCSSHKQEIILEEHQQTLKDAFLSASTKYFPANGVTPPKDFFDMPQYNTWIELMYDQNQADIMTYANNILKNGLPPGILMIDDGWSSYYGRWDFNRKTFPKPEKMVKELHDMGFKIMLWICPFISPDSVEMKDLHKKNCLVKDKSKEPAIKQWWNGYSAVLDFTNPDAENWFAAELNYLTDHYGIDGFKFDAGDGYFYSEEDITFAPTDPNGQTELWAKFGSHFPYNEYRACFRCAGLPLIQRLGDKSHSWGNNGVSSLIPNVLTQGILGYAFTCPDMIGGGLMGEFADTNNHLDEELFVRYAQCAAFMPMMQFSISPWRVLNEQNNKLCIEAANLHMEYSDYIYELAQHAAVSGEPIVRYMEYEFPHQGMECIKDQFMLGDKILVAPVCTPKSYTKTVILPEGKWKYTDGTVYEKGTVEVNAPIDVLPYFVKQ